MTSTTPRELLDQLVRARGSGDLQVALACYEQNATIATAPGVVASGSEAIRGVLEYFAEYVETFAVEHRSFIEAGDLALHLSRWRLRGEGSDGQAMEASGLSSDVLRRQADGSWLLAIDNPWASEQPGPVHEEGERDE